MYKFKVLGGSWGEGYKPGDIIIAEAHAMADRLIKKEVEKMEGVFETYASGIVKEVLEETLTEETKEENFVCPKCGKSNKSNAGLKAHLRFCK